MYKYKNTFFLIIYLKINHSWKLNNFIPEKISTEQGGKKAIKSLNEKKVCEFLSFKKHLFFSHQYHLNGKFPLNIVSFFQENIRMARSLTTFRKYPIRHYVMAILSITFAICVGRFWQHAKLWPNKE